MLVTNLYETVLLDPAKSYENLIIVSGYASATFVRKHLEDLDKIGCPDAKISLIIGMPSKRGDHLGYLSILDDPLYQSRFTGYYYSGSPPVHCKAYAWMRASRHLGYTGSANYSSYGFLSSQQLNQLTEDDPHHIADLYHQLLPDCVSIRDAVVSQPQYDILEDLHSDGSVEAGKYNWLTPMESVRISFLDRNGDLPRKSGINWGQRPKREPNQAYLPIRGDVRNEGFLPPFGFTFTLITDDGKALDCTVQQSDRKAVSTTHDNSELGRYLRNRLGVAHGTLVTAEDLLSYGRTDFTLARIDDETFLFDFSLP